MLSNVILDIHYNWPISQNAHNSKITCQNQLKLSTQHKDINMYQKM